MGYWSKFAIEAVCMAALMGYVGCMVARGVHHAPSMVMPPKPAIVVGCSSDSTNEGECNV